MNLAWSPIFFKAKEIGYSMVDQVGEDPMSITLQAQIMDALLAAALLLAVPMPIGIDLLCIPEPCAVISGIPLLVCSRNELPR